MPGYSRTCLIAYYTSQLYASELYYNEHYIYKLMQRIHYGPDRATKTKKSKAEKAKA